MREANYIFVLRRKSGRFVFRNAYRRRRFGHCFAVGKPADAASRDYSFLTHRDYYLRTNTSSSSPNLNALIPSQFQTEPKPYQIVWVRLLSIIFLVIGDRKSVV